jgi:hypothetical protein
MTFLKSGDYSSLIFFYRDLPIFGLIANNMADLGCIIGAGIAGIYTTLFKELSESGQVCFLCNLFVLSHLAWRAAQSS